VEQPALFLFLFRRKIAKISCPIDVSRYHEKFLVLEENFIIAWINGGVDSKPALEQCSLAKCSLWKNGFCDHLDIREIGQ